LYFSVISSLEYITFNAFNVAISFGLLAKTFSKYGIDKVNFALDSTCNLSYASAASIGNLSDGYLE
jgi:hypothetical protein